MRAPTLVALAFLASCVQADLDHNGFYICTVDEHCPPGKTCAHNRCYDDPPPCSPYDSAGCSADQRCGRFVDTAGTIDILCGTAGSAGLGETCSVPSDCAHGLDCIGLTFTDGSTRDECRDLCRSDEDCSPGWSCSSSLVERPDHARWGKLPIGLCAPLF